MDNRAQAGLEYLMTYGWALILIATVIGVLVFIVGSPAPNVVFSSSDPTKLLLKAASVDASTGEAKVVLQNLTGGKISISAITFSGDLSDSFGFKLNGQVLDEAGDFPIEVVAGGEMHLEGINVSNSGENGGIEIAYMDAFGLQKESGVTSGSGGIAGLVASYGFEEGSGGAGTLTADGSGNKNHGTLAGPPTWQSSGCLSGSCLDFDGGGDYVDCGSNPVLDITGPITISVWIKPGPNQEYCWDGATGNYGVAGKAQSGVPGNVWSWQLRYGAPSGCFLGFQFNGTDGGKWVTMNQALTQGQWHHIAATFDGTTLKSYLNGGFVEEATMAGIRASNARLIIADEGWANYFTGSIDEFKLFNTGLSAGEICTQCINNSASAGISCNC